MPDERAAPKGDSTDDDARRFRQGVNDCASPDERRGKRRGDCSRTINRLLRMVGETRPWYTLSPREMQDALSHMEHHNYETTKECMWQLEVLKDPSWVRHPLSPMPRQSLLDPEPTPQMGDYSRMLDTPQPEADPSTVGDMQYAMMSTLHRRFAALEAHVTLNPKP